MTARNVMYWNTRRKPNSGESVCSHWARLSSMAGLLRVLFLLLRARRDRLDHALHPHEPRALHEHAGDMGQFLQHGSVERIDRREVAAAHGRGLVADREEVFDRALARMLA